SLMSLSFFFLLTPPPPRSTLFPYTTLFRSGLTLGGIGFIRGYGTPEDVRGNLVKRHEGFKIKVPIASAAEVSKEEEEEKYFYLIDRKSTRLNSSHVAISYAVFCLKKKKHNK